MEARKGLEQESRIDSIETWGSERNCRRTFGKNKNKKVNGDHGYRLQLHQKQQQGLARRRRRASVYAMHQASHSGLHIPPCLHGERVPVSFVWHSRHRRTA